MSRASASLPALCCCRAMFIASSSETRVTLTSCVIIRGMGKPMVAKHGMVATTHPHAARIGVEMTQRGGNAIDAAVATSVAMGLMEPMSCGIGGDLFAIVWNGEMHGLN